MIAIVRLNTSSPGILIFNSYYTYTGFLFFFLILIITLIPALKSQIFLKRGLKTIALSTLIISVWVVNINNTYLLNKINNNIKETQTELAGAIYNIKDTLKKQSPNVRVSFDLNKSEKIYSFQGIPYTTLFFREYEDNIKPDFLISIRDGKINILKTNESELMPTLIKAGNEYNIYYFKGAFYALNHLEGPFISASRKYQSLIKAKSTEELELQIAKAGQFKFNGKSPKGAEPTYIFEDDYKGYQIVRSNGLFYAIPIKESPFDLFKLTKNNYSSKFFGNSIIDLKESINKNVPRKNKG